MDNTFNSEIALSKRLIKYTSYIISGGGVVTVGLVLLALITVGIASSSRDINMGGSSSLDGKVPAQFIEDFNYAAGVSGIPNWVLAAVCKHESSFKMDVVSSAGAYGLMQFRKYENNGDSNWDYYMKNGMDEWFKQAGFTYSDTEEAWGIFLNSSKMQVLAGSFSLMEKGNYALKAVGILDSIQPFNKENMALFPWGANDRDPVLRNSLRRLFAVYNYGQGKGMTVDLDNADANYPNKVYATAIEFRAGGIGSEVVLDGVIGRAIEIGKGMIGKTTYVYGGGRNQHDIDRGRFDCSSSVHYMYKMAGLELGPVSSATTHTLINMGPKISFEELIPGDLVFLNTVSVNGHMGLYIGNNQFLHCGVGSGVVIAEFNSYWRPKFSIGVRVATGGEG